jgi:hypothetical protein
MARYWTSYLLRREDPLMGSSTRSTGRRGTSSSTSGPPGTADKNDKSTSKFDGREIMLRFMIAVVGIALVTCGVITALMDKDGVATAALLAAGFGLLFISYLGQYITKVKFRDFEAELDHFREEAVTSLQMVQEMAAEAVSKLEEASRSYESIRAAMTPGGMRDAQMERVVAAAMRLVIANRMSPDEIKERFDSHDEGDRILVLAAMKTDPGLRDFQIILEAIRQPRSPFEQDRFMLIACEILGDLDAEQRLRLRETVGHLRETGRIKPNMARWYTSERLFRLLERIEADLPRQ